MRPALAAVLLLAACSHSDPSPGAPDAGADDTADAAPDATCGGQKLDLTYVPPNLGIVLDRSCSMQHALDGVTTTKWEASVAAIKHVINQHAQDVRWGLTMFPDTTGDRCGQDAIPVPIGDAKGTAIKQLLTAALDTTDPNYPAAPCVTNIDTGLEQAATDPALADGVHPGYMMLVTDGAQSSVCDIGGGAAGAEQALADLKAQRNITTFVVGFGSEVNAAELNRLATAGGAPQSGTTKYYQADTAAQLDTVIGSIAGVTMSCSYTVDPAPDDLSKTYVVFNGTSLVPRDPSHAAGWDYDPLTKQMTFYGAYCDQVQAHAVSDLAVTFGCPTPPIL